MIGGPVLGSGPPLFFAASVLPPFRFAAAGRWLTQPVRAQGPRLFPSLQTRPYLKNMRPELFEKLAAQLHRARAREADRRNQLKWSTPAAREEAERRDQSGSSGYSVDAPPARPRASALAVVGLSVEARFLRRSIRYPGQRNRRPRHDLRRARLTPHPLMLFFSQKTSPPLLSGPKYSRG